MIRVNIKPLSVNEVWRGKRFKTPAYSAYEKQVLLTLKPLILVEPPFYVKLKFGFSSKGADIDNPVKPVLDILQKRFKFNDRDIYKLTVEKEITAKGKEFFEFEIHTYNHWTKKL